MFEGAFQPIHWVVVAVIFTVFFGGKKLPELGKGLGEAIRGFKSAMREGEHPAPPPAIPENSTTTATAAPPSTDRPA